MKRDENKNNESEAKKVLSEWSLRGGDPFKSFSEECKAINPQKAERATSDSWDILAPKGNRVTGEMDFFLTEEQMKRVKLGHIPKSMEDHWFMYCDDKYIRYYRSWTGLPVFFAKYKKIDTGYKIYELTVTDDFFEMEKIKFEADFMYFLSLLVYEFGGNSKYYWGKYIELNNQPNRQPNKPVKTKFKNKNYLRQAILGVIVGDALGVPYECKRRDTFKVDGMTGGGTYGWIRGTWSDDSSMTLATLASFIICESIDYTDIMTRFMWWSESEAYCPHEECFDIGFTTQRAIARFKEGRKPTECGGKGFSDNGNGALMRILPIAFIEHENYDIVNLSSLTHAHEISCMCCRLYVQIAENLMNGMTKYEAIKNLTQCVDECERIPVLNEIPREQIRSHGYVVDTFEAAVWCLLHTNSYRECVITAVELGHDTDTVAAVAGGLAGIYYGIGGEKGIPQEWIDVIARKEWIDGMINKAISM